MRLSKLWLLSLCLALSACSRGGDATTDAVETGTFYLQPPVGGDAEETTDGVNFANIPKDRKFNFAACFADVGVQQPVVGAKMQVEGGLDVQVRNKDSRTDGKGCFYWSERIPFDATKQETFYEIHRTIRALDQQQGQVDFHVGINPWQKGAAAVRDLTVSGAPRTVPFNQINQPVAKVDENVGFAVEGVETNFEIRAVQPRHRRPGRTDALAGELRVIFQPKLRRPSIDGRSYELDSIRGGEYKVSARLVTIAGGQEIPFTDELVDNDAKYGQGGVRAEGRVKLLRKIRRDAELQLDFTAVPTGENARFGRVHGRVPLGTLGGFITNKMGPLTLIKDDSQSAALLTAAQAAPENFDFELSKVSVSQVVVKELDSTGRPRLLELQFSAFPYSGVTHGKIFKEPFQIAWSMNGATGKVAKPVETDDETGELRWWQTVPIDFYRKQEPPRMELALRPVNKIYGSRYVHRGVYLDVWAFESPGAIALDEEKMGAPRPSVVDAAGNAEMTISYSMFNFLKRDFQIDSNLGLSTTRQYRLELEPMIRRMSRDKGWGSPVSVGNGRYKVRFMIETTGDNPEIIDAVTEPMEARNGKISATVTFTLNDVRYAAVRTNLTVQVLPLEADSSLVSTPYIGTFDLVTGFVVRFEPRKDNADIGPRMDAFLARRTKIRQAGPDFFAEARSIKMLDKAKMKSMGFSEQQLAGNASWGEAQGLKQFCDLFFGPATSYKIFSDAYRCQSHPQEYIKTSNTQHMRKLNGYRQMAPPDAKQLSVSAGVSYSYSESSGESVSRDWSWKAGTDVGFKLGYDHQRATDAINKRLREKDGFFKNLFGSITDKGVNAGIVGGVDTGFGYGWSWGYSDSKDYSKSKSRSADESKAIRVDDLQFLIDAEVDQCTVISAPNAVGERRQPYMYCADQAVRKKFTEHYFHIFQEARPGPIQDDGARFEDRPLIALVRGTPIYEEFRNLLMDPNATLNINNKEIPVPYYMWRQLEKRSDGFFPGLLTQ